MPGIDAALNGSEISSISNEWLAALPPELVEQHFSLDRYLFKKIPKDNSGLLPT